MDKVKSKLTIIKTSYILFFSKPVHKGYGGIFDIAPLKHVSNTKFLGMVTAENLS